MRTLRKVSLIISLLAILLVPFGQTAKAATFHDQFRTNGTGALAEWDTMNGTLEHYTFVLADKSDQGLMVMVQMCDADWTDPINPIITCQWGTAAPASNSFSMDKKMNSASLVTTPVDLFDDFGNFVKTSNVQVTWTGLDTPVRSSDHIVSKFGTFREVFRDKQTLRNAGAVGTMDGSTISGFMDGVMAKYKVADFLSIK